MLLYSENGEKIRYKTEEQIGGEMYGRVYRISQNECLKVYKRGKEVNKEILKFIKNLMLKNYYKIHDFYYNKNGDFRAHTMQYYQKEDIDILTMPVDYTLDNLYTLYSSVNTLTQNNIFISDMHTGNIIINGNDITVIDADLYCFNHVFTMQKLQLKNLFSLKYLFEEIYVEAIKRYHSEIEGYRTNEVVRNIFLLYPSNSLEEVSKKLIKYKYPIEYIKTKL